MDRIESLVTQEWINIGCSKTVLDWRCDSDTQCTKHGQGQNVT